MKKGILIAAVAAVAGALSAWIVTKAAGSDQTAQQVMVATDGGQYRTVNLSLDDYPDFTYAAESAVDAVVYVKVVSREAVRNPQSIFDFFFGYGATPQERERVGSGSGVIIREDGYIVTNNHVIEGATEIEVTLTNNKTFKAELIGADPATDVALIKVDAQGLPTIPFGDSDRLRLGEWVLAIGSPYNLRSTVTAGIVSAKGRSIPDNSREFKIESFIQTDAAVNPGNSGGALVDKAGNLVGINTAIVSQTGAYAGYSFAVPVNIVKKIVSDLIDFGSVRRAVLGVTMSPVTQEIADKMKLSSLNGVYIVEVSPGSAAEKAGVRKEDILIAIDSVKITNASSVQQFLPWRQGCTHCHKGWQGEGPGSQVPGYRRGERYGDGRWFSCLLRLEDRRGVQGDKGKARHKVGCGDCLCRPRQDNGCRSHRRVCDSIC